MTSADGPAQRSDHRMGVLAALAAYSMWGLFPLLFKLLEGVDAATIVAHRVVWSFVLVGLMLALGGRLSEVRTALRDRKVAQLILLSSVLLAINWLVYVWAVEHERVLETSLGYFITPLFNVAIGMVLLKERQRPLQSLAILVAVLAVAIQAVGLGGIPWVAIALAVSFGFYSYFRKTIDIGSAPGLFAESMMLLPVALGYLLVTAAIWGPGPHADPEMLAFLFLTGPATAAALIFFAYGAKRLRLSTIGMFQYIAPSLQFLIAVWLFHEPINETRLFSFALIWLSLAIFSVDSFRHRQPRAVLEPAA